MTHSPIKSGIKMAGVAVTLGGLALAFGLFTVRAKADAWNKKTIFTIDQPMQVTDTYLEPGTYVFKLADSSSDRHIVYIYNRDENHLINTVMAIPNYRLEPTDKSRFIFWETPPGSAKALRAWFWPGDNFGQEFRYPKHLRTIETAALVTRQTQTVTDQVSEPVPPPPPAPEVAPEPAPQAEVTQPQVEETKQEEVVIAQNTPPPPPAAEPAPAPAPPPPPEELPKTATPYPLIGLGGLLSLGVFGLLKLKGTA